jgi:hypothetical protein
VGDTERDGTKSFFFKRELRPFFILLLFYNKEVGTDLALGLEAVGDKPAELPGFIEDDEVVIIDRIEGHGKLLGSEIALGGGIVTGDEEVIATEGVSGGCVVKSETVGEDERVIIVVSTIDDVRESFLVPPSFEEARLGVDTVVTVSLSGIKDFVAVLIDVKDRDVIGRSDGEVAGGQNGTAFSAEGVGMEEVIFIGNNTVNDLYPFNVFNHALGFCSTIFPKDERRDVLLTFLKERDIFCKERFGTIKMVGLETKHSKVTVGFLNLPFDSCFEMRKSGFQVTGFETTDAEPMVIGAIIGRFLDKSLEDGFGFLITPLVVQLLGLVKTLSLYLSCGKKEEKGEGVADKVFHYCWCFVNTPQKYDVRIK